MEKKILIGVVIALTLVLTMGIASAEFWACFEKGEVRSYCSNYKDPETCGLDNGCSICMKEYRESENCYVHGAWPKCNQLPQECSMFNGNASFDIDPPIITFNSPVQDEVYTSRSVILDIDVNEKSDIYYLDNINGRGKWKRVCTNCYGYDKKRNFKEGLNDLTFRAKDVVGNPAYLNVSFFIDSKDPRIRRTNPRRGFADGNFEVQFSEENPESLILYYGNNDYELDIENDCYINKKKYYCDVDVDLSSYDGQEITYWFSLTDIAGNVDESKPRTLDVDTTPPVVNNPVSFYNYENGSKYVYFNISVTEENFDEVVYSYIDDRGRLKEKRLCSRLKDGMCYKKKSFRRGEYNLTVSIWDEAGNSVGYPASFVVDY